MRRECDVMLWYRLSTRKKESVMEAGGGQKMESVWHHIIFVLSENILFFLCFFFVIVGVVVVVALLRIAFLYFALLSFASMDETFFTQIVRTSERTLNERKKSLKQQSKMPNEIWYCKWNCKFFSFKIKIMQHRLKSNLTSICVVLSDGFNFRIMHI